MWIHQVLTPTSYRWRNSQTSFPELQTETPFLAPLRSVQWSWPQVLLTELRFVVSKVTKASQKVQLKYLEDWSASFRTSLAHVRPWVSFHPLHHQNMIVRKLRTIKTAQSVKPLKVEPGLQDPGGRRRKLTPPGSPLPPHRHCGTHGHRLNKLINVIFKKEKSKLN